ncbi:MAG: aminotransferase class V-fold PLP-dependent enzyme [Acidobacteriota bacterium]
MSSEVLYLDNAATSYPKPPGVYDVLGQYLLGAGANPGRSGHRMAVQAERAIEETRVLVARMFGLNDWRRVIFTLNTTDSLNLAMKGVLRSGDHVITSLLEHNSVSRPLQRLFQDHVISLTQLPFSGEGFVEPDEVRRAIRPETRLIVITHVSNVLGTIQPIEQIGRIAHEAGVLFLVDAAQSAGVLPISMDAWNIDLLAMPGHKALMGPPGVGILLAGERVQLAPWREGGTGGNSEDPVQPEDWPFRLEAGTPNTVGIAALRAGLEFVLKEGLDKIAQHERSLGSRLIEGLRDDPRVRVYGTLRSENRTGPISINLQPYTSAEAAAALDQGFDIAVRPGLHCAPYAHRQLQTLPEGALRISPGYFNTESDIDRCLEALRELLD